MHKGLRIYLCSYTVLSLLLNRVRRWIS